MSASSESEEEASPEIIRDGEVELRICIIYEVRRGVVTARAESRTGASFRGRPAIVHAVGGTRILGVEEFGRPDGRGGRVRWRRERTCGCGGGGVVEMRP